MDKYPTTPDGRYFIVNNRKWRATDPTIPAALQTQLIAVLMAARRDVANALRNKDEELEKAARKRVHDAKIALGERGEVWWETYSEQGLQQRIKNSIITLLRHREAGKSICLSEVSRIVGSPDDWRTLMPTVRKIAITLAKEKVISITRGAEELDPDDLGKGHIRLRHGKRFD